MPIQNRSLWSSRFAFIMVTAGAAIGLGNIWKFPYMAGSSGGGAFVVTYLICILVIGIPAMIAEIMIGRSGRQNPVNSLETLAVDAHHSPAWKNLGWFGALILLIVLSFYSVVAGWSIAYLVKSLSGAFIHASPESILAIWQTLLDSPATLIGWHSLFMFLTLAVVALGVNAGIEKASRWMMPGLFITLILLVIYAAIEGDFKQAALFLFSFKREAFTTGAIINAMGQAFFSLATGAGAILIYGSYLSKDTDIVDTVFIVSLLNVLVAILSGLAIFPIVFSHGLQPEGGPGLMFNVLPIAFSHMPGSWIVGSFFFLLLLFAAWTSSISLAEPLVSLLHERHQLSRPMSSLIIGSLAWVLGLVSVFSFNIWKDVQIFHWGIFQIMTDLPTNILLPIGAFLFCIFAGWIMKHEQVKDQFGAHRTLLFPIWRFSIRYIAPLGILIILLAHLLM